MYRSISQLLRCFQSSHPNPTTWEEADILVGADGIWSAVRAQMYNEGKVKERSKECLNGARDTINHLLNINDKLIAMNNGYISYIFRLWTC